MRRQSSKALRPTALPSKHYGTDFWFIDGPFGGRCGPYRGKRVRVTVALRPSKDVVNANPAKIAGEYVHQTRNVGKGLGYEHYYQWFGPANG